MAERRMFSCKITSSDAFKMMSLAAQALYFQLGMEADDDGFVNNAVSIARSIGAGTDEIEEIISNRFAIRMNKKLLVIKHWKINNYIQKDRYHETAYKAYKDQLIIKDNDSYTEKDKSDTRWSANGYDLDTACIQGVSKMDTEVRIGKDSKDNKVSVVPSKKNLSIKKKSLIDETDTLFAPSDSDESSEPTEKEENDPIFIKISLISGEDYPIRESVVKMWEESYPAVDVRGQLREMKSWCFSNPKERKTARGIMRFCNNWLSREQDRAGRFDAKTKPVRHKDYSDISDEALEKEFHWS